MYSWTVFAFLATILLSSCAAPTPQLTETAVPTSTRAAISTSTETPEPIPAPTDDEQANTAEVTDLLADLDYDAADHESFGPANNHIGTVAELAGTDKAIDWLPADTQLLINTNPNTGEQRVDATLVDVNGDGQPEWVRGLHYPVSGYGGMSIDVIVHPQQDGRAYLAGPEAAQAIYGELLTAIAHQTGMSEAGLQNYLASHDNKIEIRLPEFWNPDNHSRNRSPSYLQASEPTVVDLSKPIVYASRSGVYLDQEVAPGVAVPDGIRWVAGSSDTGIAVFVANEQLFIVFEADGNVTADRIGNIPSRLLRSFEAIAGMRPGFVDTQGEGNSLLEEIARGFGRSYSDGDTVVDRDVFFTTLPDFSDFDFTVFEWK